MTLNNKLIEQQKQIDSLKAAIERQNIILVGLAMYYQTLKEVQEEFDEAENYKKQTIEEIKELLNNSIEHYLNEKQQYE